MFTNRLTGEETRWISFDIINVKTNCAQVKIWKYDEVDFTAIRYLWNQQPCEFKKCVIYSGDKPAPPFLYYGPFT